MQGQFSSVFPVQCCVKSAGSRRPATVLRRRFEHLLSPEVNSTYAQKEIEYFTPTALKLYCVKCRAFLPPKTFTNQGAYTIATCDCGTIMCVGCKGIWKDKHRCIDDQDPHSRPDWLPEYTPEFRVKKCPGCKMYIEHESACNHMTCQYCRHEFCFICLLPWSPEQTHEDDGCPMYGDPRCGYDEEGYEKSDRELHRDTGLTRAGLDRKGNTPVITYIAEPLDNDGDWSDAWSEPDDQDNRPIHNTEENDDREYDGPQIHINPEDVADQEFRDELDATIPWHDFSYPFPGQASNLSFDQIECEHEWTSNSTYFSNYGETCAVCDYFMPYFNYTCTICAVRCCNYCSSSWSHRLQWYNPAAENMVGVIQFAEKGEVPFKAHRRAFWRAIQEADAVPVWSVRVMLKQYEDELLDTDPFYYGDLGIQEMFQEAEMELSYREWYVREENVGWVGNTMTFNMHENSFVLLFLNERD